jgi:Leucine-rich repeat (LRR) protein
MEEALLRPAAVKILELKEPLSEELLNMPALEELILKGTAIKKLPDWFCKLTNIKAITIINNYKLVNKKNFKLLSKLPKLERLQINEGQLPAEIGLFTELKELIAKDQEELPEELFNLTKLQKLILQNGGLKEVPESIGKFKELKEIDLSSHLFEKFPIALLSLSNLEILSLENNYIQELPEQFANLKKLKHLNIKETKLKHFPEEIISLESLESLNISNYSWECEVPERLGELKKLKRLDLSYLKLEKLPKFIGELGDLECLNLQNNYLEEDIGNFGKHEKLKYLNLQSCHLKSIPMDILSMTSLGYLNLSNNHISEIPKEMGKLTELEELNLSSIGIKTLPMEIRNLKKLQKLYLGFNPISSNKEMLEEILLAFPKCSCDVFGDEKLKPNLAEKIVIDGLKGSDKADYINKKFVFVAYDPELQEKAVVLYESDNVYELLKMAAEDTEKDYPLFYRTYLQEGEPKKWRNIKELPSKLPRTMSRELLAFLLDMRQGFSFYTKKDSYEEDIYFGAILHLMTNGSFLFGWSAEASRQDEAYAVFQIK